MSHIIAVSSRKAAFNQSLLYAFSKVGNPEIMLKDQMTAIRHIYNGKNVFVWLLTRYGKSICYEVLPFLSDHRGGKSESLSVSSVVKNSIAKFSPSRKAEYVLHIPVIYLPNTYS